MIEGQKKSLWQLYMYLLNTAIHNNQITIEELDSYEKYDIEEIVGLILHQNQKLLLFQHGEAYQNYLEGKSNLYEGIDGRAMIPSIMKEYEKYKILRMVLEEGEKRGIKWALFKGVVLADLYPKYTQRDSCDSDIYVDKKQREQAIELLLSLGYEIDEEHSKEEVTVLGNLKYSHFIELHTCLWEDFKGRRMEILDSFRMTDSSTWVNVNACGMNVPTLGFENHLIYQMFHIIKHFSLEGIGCKYLVDITLFVNRYKAQIDQEDFWKKMEQLGYTRFCYYFFTICIEFLGMDAEILGDKKVSMGEEFEAFISDLMRMGLRDDEKDAGWQIMGMMTPYFTGEKTGSKSSFRRKLQILFPRAKDLPDDLSYAKKCPILLPIAWVHKAVRYLINLRKHKKDWYNPSEKLSVAEKRIALMDTMGLLDE